VDGKRHRLRHRHLQQPGAQTTGWVNNQPVRSYLGHGPRRRSRTGLAEPSGLVGAESPSFVFAAPSSHGATSTGVGGLGDGGGCDGYAWLLVVCPSRLPHLAFCLVKAGARVPLAPPSSEQNWRAHRRNSLNLIALYRCGSGRERTRVGHQNHGPRILRMDGTTNERTISVSSSRPMHTVEPI
jgi:hypothetical protein